MQFIFALDNYLLLIIYIAIYIINFNNLPSYLILKQFKTMHVKDDLIRILGVGLVETLEPPRLIKSHLPYEILPKQLRDGKGKVRCCRLGG